MAFPRMTYTTFWCILWLLFLTSLYSGGVVKGAVTIEKDNEWDCMTASVGKQSKVVDLAVYIGTNELIPWQVLKQGPCLLSTFLHPNLQAVPHLDLLAPQDVANSWIMEDLDSGLECFVHPNESGKPGCYLVTPWGHRRVDMELESVALATVMGSSQRAINIDSATRSTTINPTSLANEAQLPGQVNLPLPTSASHPVATTTVPAPTLALIPALQTTSPIAPLTLHAGQSPSFTACINTAPAPLPSTPKHPQVTVQNTAYSTIPSKESVIPWFVKDFIEEYELESLDFSDIVNCLKDQDLTLDLLGRAPDQWLKELLGMTLGQVLKLRSFAAKWYKRLIAKLNAGAALPEV
ncbi:hypothetical protein M407DRAFT_22834 [Tulasnella calospora MUT 4182]|uniref:SAM domain-containing protein n=1 Tax=Tulasnella calospora MUT 4182 TaxID=1051891 RepID=A0A0C3QBM9_9AGAM|nr:hypothetical protein M407DRAFT_22834 [Tulasnella calospora MUT 4182]